MKLAEVPVNPGYLDPPTVFWHATSRSPSDPSEVVMEVQWDLALDGVNLPRGMGAMTDLGRISK
jgi:hypothetical protein